MSISLKTMPPETLFFQKGLLEFVGPMGLAKPIFWIPFIIAPLLEAILTNPTP